MSETTEKTYAAICIRTALTDLKKCRKFSREV